MANYPQLVLGVAQYFVPICIRRRYGFYGGPAGYQEMWPKERAERKSPIVLDGTWAERRRISRL